MRLSAVLLAVLPALAAAQGSDSMTTVTDTSKTTVTTTTTDTMHLTKTVTISRVHTTASASSLNSTAVIQPTGGITLPTASSATPAPTTKGPSNAGAALDAGKVAFAGVAGVVVAALL